MDVFYPDAKVSDYLKDPQLSMSLGGAPGFFRHLHCTPVLDWLFRWRNKEEIP
jgi:hypothetical protein